MEELTLLTINYPPLHHKYASTAFYKRELYTQNNSRLSYNRLTPFCCFDLKEITFQFNVIIFILLQLTQ